MVFDLSIDELREKFRYEPDTGLIFARMSNRRNADLSLPVGTPGTDGYLRITYKNRYMMAHRIAWALHHGYWPTGMDHADRNKVNNRLDNLRLATRAQNNANRADVGRVKAKGVSVSALGKKYRAALMTGGKLVFQAEFDTIDEAAHAYNKAAIKYHGEFALLNPIGQDKEHHMQQPTDTTKGA